MGAREWIAASVRGHGVCFGAPVGAGSGPAFHQVAPDKTRVTKYQKQAKRDGVELPALRKAVAQIRFECKPEHADQSVERQELKQPFKKILLDLQASVAPARRSEERRVGKESRARR